MKRALALIALVSSAALIATTAPVQAAPSSTVAYAQHISGVGTVTYVFTGHDAAYFGGVFNGSLHGTRVSYVQGKLYAVWYQPKVKLTMGLYATSGFAGRYMASSLASSARKAGFIRVK